MLRRCSVIRQRAGYRPHRVRVYRVWRFETLEIGDTMDILNADKWHTASESARQYGQRSGRRFTATKVWIEGRDVDTRVLRIERVE